MLVSAIEKLCQNCHRCIFDCPNRARGVSVLQQKLQEIETQLQDLRVRWPAHSLKPALILQLEDLEEEKDRLKRLVDKIMLTIE